jgi:hypothetical protein
LLVLGASSSSRPSLDAMTRFEERKDMLRERDVSVLNMLRWTTTDPLDGRRSMYSSNCHLLPPSRHHGLSSFVVPRSTVTSILLPTIAVSPADIDSCPYRRQMNWLPSLY